MTLAALARLRPFLLAAGDRVWGGDGNHAMEGPDHAGSRAGQAAIRQLVADAGLVVATRNAPHAIEGLSSIDHIAVPAAWTVTSPRRIDATAEGRRLSDHDAYVVEAGPA